MEYAPLMVTRLANTAPGIGLLIVFAFPNGTIASGLARIVLLGVVGLIAATLAFRGYRVAVVVTPDALLIKGLLRDRVILREWIVSVDRSAVVRWQQDGSAVKRSRIWAFTELREPVARRVRAHNVEVIACIRKAYNLADQQP